MKVRLLKQVSKDLSDLDPKTRIRILARLRVLEKSLFSLDVKKLSGERGYRLRVGDYRIIFLIRGDLIIVSRVAHRREVYR